MPNGGGIAAWPSKRGQSGRDPPINTKEAIAARDGFFCFIPFHCRKVTLLGVGNAVAFFDLVKGASRCQAANQCAFEIRTRWRLGPIWVPTS